MTFLSFNLLAPPRQQKLRQDFWLHFLVRVLVGLTALGVVFLVLSGSVFVYLLIVRNAEGERLRVVEQQPQLVAAKILEANIRNASSRLEGAGMVLQEVDPLLFDVMRKTAAVFPQGITLDTMNMRRDAALEDPADSKKTIRAVVVDITGIAATRKDVLSLERALKELDGFVSLVSPIENIALSRDAKFRMTLVLQ